MKNCKTAGKKHCTACPHCDYCDHANRCDGNCRKCDDETCENNPLYRISNGSEADK